LVKPFWLCIEEVYIIAPQCCVELRNRMQILPIRPIDDHAGLACEPAPVAWRWKNPNCLMQLVAIASARHVG
jgi:hypothetical protein